MAIDKREDAGEFYPGGKVVPRTPVTPGGGGGDMYHSEFGDLDPETTPLAVVIERLKGTVNTIAAAICLIGSMSACAAVSVVPVYTNHNRVAGNVQTMTNMPAWASAVETAIGEIGGVTTNAVIEIVAPMTNAAVEAAVGCATNAAKAYADGTFLKTSGGTMMGNLEFGDSGTTANIYLNEGMLSLAKDVEIKAEFTPIHSLFAFYSYNMGLGIEYKSILNPDGTPVITANLATNTFPILTNAYTKTEANATFAPLTMIAATDTTFSNATVAVVNDMATRSITASVDAALTDILGADWKTTYGGGLAGIIAALVGALAWLKANKVGSFSAVGGVTPTVSGGVADVSSLFSGANTSLVAVCQQYGGTQIKRDEQGNYYYDVED